MDNPANNAHLLLPGYELDGYPRVLESERASQLLAGWISLWHPALIAQINTAPSWVQCESFTDSLKGTLVVIPDLTDLEPHEAFTEAESKGELAVLRPAGSWREEQKQALRLAGVTSPDISDELLKEFAALGYAYLQIQLMTRQLRYTSNLDQLLFSDQACQAAEAALKQDEDSAKQLLQSCFDSLGQERDHYYSLDVSLLDITLLAKSTLGKSLEKQLLTEAKTSYLASASILSAMNTAQRDRLAKAISDKRATICGGLEQERPHTLLSRDAILRDYQRGRTAYRELGFDPPKIFSRLSFGFLAEQASDLEQLGFEGALMIAWTGGAYPEGSQAKMSWESTDGNFLATIAAPVFDATDAASYLSLGWEIGEALDHQHVPTLLFAHWPGQISEYAELLHVIAARTPALGRWTTADEYFNDTDEPYHQERLNASGFRFPWISSADSPQQLLDAIKSHYQLSNRCRSLQNLLTLAKVLSNPPAKPNSPAPIADAEDNNSPVNEPASQDGDNTDQNNANYSLETTQQACKELYDATVLADELLDNPSARSEK